MLILSLQHISKVWGRGQKLEADAKGFRGKGKAEARGHEVDAKNWASKPVWPQGFNISALNIITIVRIHIIYCIFAQNYSQLAVFQL